MPIPIAPVEIAVEQVTKTTVTADKLHILRLTVADPTKDKPSIEMQVVPYAEDADGNKQFSSQIQTLRTSDMYAAINNLANAGFSKMAAAMGMVFEAAAEWVKYHSDRQADADAAKAAADKAREAVAAAIEAKADQTEIDALEAARIGANAAMMKALTAASDPAKPR